MSIARLVPGLAHAGFGLLLCLSVLPARAGAESTTLPPHPRLLLDAAGVTELRARIAAAPWAAEEWKSLSGRAESALTAPVELPPRGGNWSHNYVCPEHSARLSRGRKIGPWQWEHHCPVGPHTLRGDPSQATLDFDGNGIAAEHGDLARQVIDHGLVYQVTGDTRHAARARAILLAYAARYRKYPLHDNQGRPNKGARVASQSLTEGSWLIEIAQGADLVWSTLTEADRRTIEQGVLRACLDDVVLPAKMGIHNIKCRLNSAIGLVGFLLGDRRLIDLAIDEPRVGYRQQLAQGVLDDGMWTEGSSGYHFFTIEGLWTLAEAARHCGVNLYTDRFQKMFDAPLTFARPDLVLPDFNDSGAVPLSGHAPLYELAFARFGQPAYVPLLRASNRRNRMALLFGRLELPAGEGAALGSRNSPASGYAILQQGAGRDATWLCLKYGPHGGGHGHFDKNHFILYRQGEVLAPDGGTHAYGSPLHKDWDKDTFAHNTLVVDAKTQEKAQGACLAFGRAEGVDYAVTEAGPIYPGVRFVRTVALLSPAIVVVVDQVNAERDHTFDIVYHQVGQWGDLPTGAAWPTPKAPGYKYVTKGTVREVTPAGLVLPLRSTLPAAPAAAVLIGEGEAPGQVITGYGVLKTTTDLVPLVVQRRTGRSAVFVWGLSLEGKPVRLQSQEVRAAGGSAVPRSRALLVTATQGTQTRQLLINPDRLALAAVPGWPAAEKDSRVIAVR